MPQSHPTGKRLSKAKQEDLMIREAISVVEKRFFHRGSLLNNPNTVKEFLTLKLAPFKHEVFAVAFLDTRLRVIAFEVLFTGTINSATVPPRSLLQKALEHNSAAVILAHNHPSGDVTPSDTDKALTTKLESILTLIDVRLVDHFIIGSGAPFSFAEKGLL